MEHGRHWLGVQVAPWGLACGHLNHCAGQGPDVRGAAVARLLDDLWGHPVGGAPDGGGAWRVESAESQVSE